MHELRSRAPRQPDRVHLVPGDPLDPPPRIDRRLGDGRELAPLGPGKAVEEEGQLDVVAPRQRRHQLARIYLQPAHLSWSKEEQIHPHVHGGPD